MHPGGGIMGAPGRIAALEVVKELSKGRAGGRDEHVGSRAIRRVVVGGGPQRPDVRRATSARAGLRVLVVERRERVGGAADTIEVAPGVRAPLAHGIGRLRRSVVRDLALERHGLRFIRPDELRDVAAPGRARGAVLGATRAGRPRASANGRGRRGGVGGVRPEGPALASVMAWLHSMTPPDLVAPSLADAVAALKLGNALRGLGGPSNLRETIRVLPIAVADFVEDHLESDAVRGGGRRRRRAATRRWGRGRRVRRRCCSASSAGIDGGPAGESATRRRRARSAVRSARGRGPGGRRRAAVRQPRSRG